MPPFTVSPEASPLYVQTLNRAASRGLLLFQWSSEEEAKQAIIEVFRVASCAREITEDNCFKFAEDCYLDLAEARLAIAALNLNANGDFLVTAGEARQAKADTVDALQMMSLPSLSPKNKIDSLAKRFADRAVGWRRISRESVSREIRGVFRMPEVAKLDPRPTLDLMDVLLAAIALNHEAGGTDAKISFRDAMNAYILVEIAAAGLKNFYR